MVMPAIERRWTVREVRQLIAESPLATPRYELVDGELLVTPSPSWPHPEIVAEVLEWAPAGSTESLKLELARYFAEVFDEG